MNCSTPGLPVHHQLLEFTQTHVHRVSDAIQSSHPLSSPSPLAPNPFRSDHLLSRVQLFATPWIAALQASLSITNSQSSPRLMSIESVMHPAISSSVVPFSCPQSLPASESFPMSQLFAWGGQSTGVSALASFLPKNTQDWSLLEWTGWISLQSKGLSRVFSKMIEIIKTEAQIPWLKRKTNIFSPGKQTPN